MGCSLLPDESDTHVMLYAARSLHQKFLSQEANAVMPEQDPGKRIPTMFELDVHSFRPPNPIGAENRALTSHLQAAEARIGPCLP